MPEKKGEQWYTNKDLFELMQSLGKEMSETQKVVAKYNGLHEKLDIIENSLNEQVKRCDEVQSGKEVRQDMINTIFKFWPILISTIILILAIIDVI